MGTAGRGDQVNIRVIRGQEHSQLSLATLLRTLLRPFPQNKTYIEMYDITS